jgi:hypothetical protein
VHATPPKDVPSDNAADEAQSAPLPFGVRLTPSEAALSLYYVDMVLTYFLETRSGFMLTDNEIIVVQKATAYDIKRIIHNTPNTTYTCEELEQLLDTYIANEEKETSKQAERNDGEWKKNKMRKL